MARHRRPPACAAAASPRSARSGSTGWAASPRSADKTRPAVASRRTWSPPCRECITSSCDVRQKSKRKNLIDVKTLMRLMFSSEMLERYHDIV